MNFLRNRSSCSAKIVCNHTKTAFSLSINTSIVLIFCFFWDYHLVTYVLLEMSFRIFFTQQNRTKPTDTMRNISTTVSPRSISLQWERFLSNGPKYRFLKNWYFMFYSVVLVTILLAWENREINPEEELLYDQEDVTRSVQCISWERACQQPRQKNLACADNFLSTGLQTFANAASTNML